MKSKTAKELIEMDFSGTRKHDSFKDMSDGEYVGYISAMTLRNWGGKYSLSSAKLIEAARELLKSGVL